MKDKITTDGVEHEQVKKPDHPDNNKLKVGDRVMIELEVDQIYAGGKEVRLTSSEKISTGGHQVISTLNEEAVRPFKVEDK